VEKSGQEKLKNSLSDYLRGELSGAPSDIENAERSRFILTPSCGLMS
jgi:hypothetical protein